MLSEETHDPVNFVSQLRQVLSADKLPLAFFLGAGCPCGVRVPSASGSGTDPLIPDIRGVTVQVRKILQQAEGAPGPFAALEKTFEVDEVTNPTVEDMLNRIRAFGDVSGNAGVRGLSGKDLKTLDDLVCRTIRSVVSKPLPSQSTPYHALADFVRMRRHPVAEIFTTNYDLLVEEALESRRVPYFDGFVGSVRPFFEQRAVEENEAPERWAHLWKIHGSVNWRIDRSTSTVFRSATEDDGDELLIHPSRLKYDESRRMPYVVMIDRLRDFLRKQRPAALIVAGYSFGDEHINAAIVEGLQSNPSAACFALQHGSLSKYPSGAALANRNLNLALFAEDRAVFRGREAPWAPHPAVDQGFLNGAFSMVASNPPEVSPSSRATLSRDEEVIGDSKLLLGDFAALGDFLQQFVGLGKSIGNESVR